MFVKPAKLHSSEFNSRFLMASVQRLPSRMFSWHVFLQEAYGCGRWTKGLARLRFNDLGERTGLPVS